MIRGLTAEHGVMLRTDVVSDELWAVLGPWPDLSLEFGAYQSVWERHRRWSTDGTYARMFAKVRAEAGDEQRELLGLFSVDSTSVRAHQHAAGARPTVATGGWME